MEDDSVCVRVVRDNLCVSSLLISTQSMLLISSQSNYLIKTTVF